MSDRHLATRPAAVAGAFYPADRAALERSLQESFAGAVVTAGGDPPKALVVPHAGYVYSGPIAASAYARLAPLRSTVRRIVLLGPSHRVALRGLAVPSVDAFETPLGAIPIDRDGRDTVLRSCPVVTVDDLPHAYEHSLEVQLPFLQSVLDEFVLLPFAVGHASPAEVAQVLDTVWGGVETLVVVSTDLSHYERYEVARVRDARTAGAVTALAAADIDDTDACGAYGLRGLVVSAASRHLSVELLDLRNSGDTAGDRRRVVGYGAFALA